MTPHLDISAGMLAQAAERGGVWGIYLSLIAPFVILAIVVCLNPVGKRELKSYFLSPIAYVCITIFVLLAMVIAFFLGGIIERGEASLVEFFFYQPFIWVIVGPALGMRLWAEENRLGTIELIGTMPVNPWVVVLFKYLASLVVIAVALGLTFPIVITIEYLGEPDHGVIVAGYVASFLVGAATLAITSAVSAFTRNQVVCLLVSVVIGFFLAIGGFPPVMLWIDSLPESAGAILDWWPKISLYSHFLELVKGVLQYRDILFFALLIAACLTVTSIVLRAKRA